MSIFWLMHHLACPCTTSQHQHDQVLSMNPGTRHLYFKLAPKPFPLRQAMAVIRQGAKLYRPSIQKFSKKKAAYIAVCRLKYTDARHIGGGLACAKPHSFTPHYLLLLPDTKSIHIAMATARPYWVPCAVPSTSSATTCTSNGR